MAKVKQIEETENNIEAGGAADPSGGVQPVEVPVQEEVVTGAKPATPLPAKFGDQVVYYSKFGGAPSVAFVASTKDGITVDLIALVWAETPPCTREQYVPYSKDNKPGSWNWGI